VPINSVEGQNYLDAMACGANYGWANRHVMGHYVREVFEEEYGSHVDTVYDVTHNIAKVERHTLDGSMEDLQIIRKGATRAFPAGRSELPAKYMDIGQPVLIPGSMGTSSYVLVGTETGMTTTFGSVNHGAGRVMGRTQASEVLKNVDVRGELAAKGITVLAPPATRDGDPIKDEAPQAYKDIDMVIDVDVRAGLAKLVARMVPIAVMKG
jgi:tRNA-splicing ligase RtcB